jgi:hypothetical protein
MTVSIQQVKSAHMNILTIPCAGGGGGGEGGERTTRAAISFNCT